jgi:hypothetical protein
MIMNDAMTRATLTVAVALLCNTAAAAPLVTYQSACECLDNHGKQRWAEKNDPALPPSDASAIQALTPSDIFNWQGPTEYLVPSSERIWSEQKWYFNSSDFIGFLLHLSPPTLLRTAHWRRQVFSAKVCSDITTSSKAYTSRQFSMDAFLTPTKTPNQSMKPTAPGRYKFSELATTSCRGLSPSR